MKKEPSLESIPYWINFKTMCFHDGDLISALINLDPKDIVFVDMQEILGDRAFETMINLAKKFGFSAPKESDKEALSRRVSNWQLGFPYVFSVNPLELVENANFLNQNANLEAEKITLNITTCYDIKEGQINITDVFFKDSIAPIVITSTPLDCQRMLQNMHTTNLISAKLREFVNALFEKHDKEEAKRLNESVVLEYFKENPYFRDKFKLILESHTKIIQQQRPDIVNSWKHYQEFLKLCR